LRQKGNFILPVVTDKPLALWENLRIFKFCTRGMYCDMVRLNCFVAISYEINKLKQRVYCLANCSVRQLTYLHNCKFNGCSFPFKVRTTGLSSKSLKERFCAILERPGYMELDLLHKPDMTRWLVFCCADYLYLERSTVQSAICTVHICMLKIQLKGSKTF